VPRQPKEPRRSQLAIGWRFHSLMITSSGLDASSEIG
jgi:hypothetical protein